METINFGVVYAYLTCQNYSKQYEQRHGYFRVRNLRDLLEREKFMWAIAVKEKNGMEKLDAHLVELMNLYDGVADTWLLTPKTAVYLRLVPSHKTDYYLAGPAGPARVNDTAFGARPQERNAKRLHDVKEPYAIFNKYNVYLTRSYNVEETGPIDIMSQVSSQGEFFRIVKPSSAPDYSKKWSARLSDTRIYDEENNCGYTVTKSMGINYCQVFDADGAPREVAGNNVDPVDASDLDRVFFLRRRENALGGAEYKPIQYMGDINHVFCDTNDVADLARATISSLFSKAEKTKLSDALAAGYTRIRILGNTPITSTTALPGTPGLDLSLGVGGAPPAVADADLGGWVTWSALVALRGRFPELGAFISAVDDIARRIVPVYGLAGNFLFDKRNAVDPLAGIPAVLYENVIVPGSRRLFTRGAANGPAVPGAPALDLLYAQQLRYFKQGLLNPGDANDLAELTRRGVGAGELAALTAERAALDTAIANPSAVEYEKRRAKFEEKIDTWAAGTNAAERRQWLRDLDNSTKSKVAQASARGAATLEGQRYGAGVDTGLAVLADVKVPAGFVPAGRYNPTVPSGQEEVVSRVSATDVETFTIATQMSDMPVFAGLIGAQLAGIGDNVDDSYSTNLGGSSFATANVRGGGSSGKSYMQYEAEEQQPIGYMMSGADSDYNPRNNSKFNRARAAEAREQLRADQLYVPAVGNVLAGGEAVNVRFGNMAKNIELLTGSQSDLFVKLVAMAYFAAPWRRQTLLAMEQNNVPAPVGFLGFRVGMYDMAIGIKLQSGTGTAFTAFGNSSFMLSDDAVLKVHYGNYTHYSKTVVREEKNVFVAYNIAPNRALGGMGVTPYKDQEQFRREDNMMLADIFYVMIPYTETEFSQVISMAGRFYTYMDAGMIDAEDPQNRELHYTTAAYYNRFWGWYNSENIAPSLDDPLYQQKGGAFRLEVWQGDQGSFNPDTKKYDRDIIPSSSPWGRAAVGSRQVRNGEMAEMPVVPPHMLGF